MSRDDILILKGDEISALLAGREADLIDTVERAYLAHERGESSLPHSTFLRFPGDDTNRIIGLPAFLGDGFGVAGMKWIASFPANVGRGLARASAVLVLNSCETGRPQAILEGSIISARRTAASAALAARVLAGRGKPDTIGMIGTGVIQLEIARFTRVAVPSLSRFVLFDLDRGRSERFAATLERELGGVTTEIAASGEEALGAGPLVSFATTAIHPHVDDLSPCPPGATLLHVSLRDLTVAAILAADNVVDDADHVCRAQTSVHLAEQKTGGRGFIRASLAQVIAGQAPPKADPAAVTVFSPFGLGVLDLAVGQRAVELARAAGRGTVLSSFLPSESFL